MYKTFELFFKGGVVKYKTSINMGHEEITPETNIKKNKNDVEESDADIDRNLTEGEFADIGKKRAGENNIEEEIKGSDADRSI